jgi:hypothetical protein
MFEDVVSIPFIIVFNICVRLTSVLCDDILQEIRG